ncbi:hypothetical protein F5Y10DRAFT_287042 [Nemania abortiva]|nr:hypothetical protein F5Y10DRAFT_287042 [Nemania abortiva]
MEALTNDIHALGLTPKPSCCNDSNGIPCRKPGSFACKSCLMVTYCGKACQKAHWQTHQKDCKSSFMQETWEPRWMIQNRTPAFIGGLGHTIFGAPKYLWGNVPAIDVIQLNRNEGPNYEGPLNMLFAASGDMRNAVISVANLPPSYRGFLNIVINDLEFDVVARNLIFLLIFLVEDDPIIASECVLHLWYSAFIPDSCNHILRKNIKPLIEEVCGKIEQKTATTRLGKTWQFGESSVRLVLSRENWMSLLRYLDVPQGLTKNTAQQVRQKVMSAPERIDYVDRALCTMSPSAKMGMMKFREDGILLPFGQTRETFTHPNPTMFASLDRWPMMDDADPTAGWPMKVFMKFDAGPATNDVYGKLHFYLKDMFASFHRQIRSSPVAFELLCVDARALPQSLSGRYFDRIDVGNICDLAYLGTNTTLKTFRGLLQPLSINSHATLITLFLNAVADVMSIVHSAPAFVAASFIADKRKCMRKLFQYIPELRQRRVHPYHPSFIKATCALSLVHDTDMYFDYYMYGGGFERSGLGIGLRMKSAHTIVDPWPWRMPDGRPTQETREEFALLLSSSHTGQERFVEWKLKAEPPVEDASENNLPGPFGTGVDLVFAEYIVASALFRE